LKESSQILVELTLLAKVLKEKNRLRQVVKGDGELEPNIFPRELVSGPKVPLRTWFTLGNGWTWGNHVCLKNLSPCAQETIFLLRTLSTIKKIMFWSHLPQVFLWGTSRAHLC
jgi:hypothetical protein